MYSLISTLVDAERTASFELFTKCKLVVAELNVAVSVDFRLDSTPRRAHFCWNS